MAPSSTETLKHAAIGAVVSLVTFFLPFSPVIGGGVAGYLHGSDRTEGAKVGGLSGLLAAVPVHRLHGGHPCVTGHER